MAMKTCKAYTHEILGGYLMNNNKVNVEYLAHCINVYAVNGNEALYNEIKTFNPNRRKRRNVAINELMQFVNYELQCAGYKNYYATNAQVMQFDKMHGGSLEEVLDILEELIAAERAEV